jgi:hypothetical protein
VARYRSNGPGGGNGRFAVSLAPKLLVRYRPERPMKRTSVAWPVDREADSRTPPSWAFKLTHHRGATPAPYVRAPDFATLPYRSVRRSAAAARVRSASITVAAPSIVSILRARTAVSTARNRASNTAIP